jgi:DNA-binding response OmpR family regulator
MTVTAMERSEHHGADCPTCGQRLPWRDMPVLDLPTNTLLIDGTFVRFEPREAEVLSVIMEGMPRVHLWGDIHARVYPLASDVSMRVIYTLVSQIRKKAAHTRLMLQTIHSRGVQAILELQDEQCSARPIFRRAL